MGTAQIIAGMLALDRGAKGAERVLEAALVAHPNEPGPRVALAGRARERGDLDRAEALLREELALPVRPPPVRAALIEILARQKDHAGQLEQLDRFLAEVPGDAVMIHARAQALFNLGRHEDALLGCETCLSVAPRSAACRLLQANVLSKLGRETEAAAAFAEARALKGLRPE